MGAGGSVYRISWGESDYLVLYVSSEGLMYRTYRKTDADIACEFCMQGEFFYKKETLYDGCI